MRQLKVRLTPVRNALGHPAGRTGVLFTEGTALKIGKNGTDYGYVWTRIEASAQWQRPEPWHHDKLKSARQESSAMGEKMWKCIIRQLSSSRYERRLAPVRTENVWNKNIHKMIACQMYWLSFSFMSVMSHGLFSCFICTIKKKKTSKHL